MLCKRCRKKETRRGDICGDCRGTLKRREKPKTYIGDDGFEYDQFHRMVYTPEFHFNQGKPWSEEELEYLCMYVDYDDPRKMGFALGRTETVVLTKSNSLRKTKMFNIYKNRYKKRMGVIDE